MVSILLLISKSSILFPSPWELFQVHQLQLVSLSPSCSTAFLVLWHGPKIWLLFPPTLFFVFTLWFAGTANSTRWLVHFFLLIEIRFGLRIGTQWCVCISKLQRILCVSFSRTDSGLCIYHLVVWSHFNLLHNSQWITFPTQSFCTSFVLVCNIHLLCD